MPEPKYSAYDYETIDPDLKKLRNIPGWLSLDEAMWLYEQARTRPRILEIGSWKGRSTYCLAQGCPGFVVAVDHFKGSVGEDAFWYGNARKGDFDSVRRSFLSNVGEHINNGRVLLIELDVEIFYSLTVNVFQHMRFDMIFIDGAHDEVSFAHDLRNCQQLLAPGGLLCGHDAFHKGVRPVLAEKLRNFTVAPRTSIWISPPEK